MTPLSDALSSALLHFLWQGLVVGLLLWVALAALRKGSAQARYIVSCGALASMAALPAITMWAVYRWVAVPHAVSAEAVGHAVAAAPLAASGNWVARMDAWALPVWSMGVLFFALRLMWGSRQVSTLRRRGEAADDAVLAAAAAVAARLGLTRPVRVLMSSLAEGPSVVGWLRPVILVPAATLAGLNPAQFEAVLAHEIAHILRYDYLVNLLQMVVEALLFYHPAVWWASARIRHERELCCDDLAVRACGDAVCYARALTTLERLRASTPALAMGTTGGRLLDRIERLMGAAPQEQSTARWPGVVALAAGLACIALTTNWARGQAPAGHAPDGPGVKVDLGASAVLHRTGVEYPEAAKKKGVQGNVTVQVTVDENGNVSDAHVLSGPEELRKSVLQSILEWHFTKDAAKSERQVGVAFQNPAAGAAEPAEPQTIAVTVLDPQGQRVEGLRMRVIGPGAAGAERAKDDPEITAVVRESQALIEQMKARIEALQNNGVPFDQVAKLELERLQAEVEQRNRSAWMGVRFFEDQMAEAQRQMAAAQAQVPRNQDEIIRAQVHLQDIQRKMETAKAGVDLAQLAQRQNEGRIAGHTLSSIQALGFPEGAISTLTSRLNLRVGDTLTTESIEAARKAVREFDEHAAVEFLPTFDGQVEMRILAPR